ncbi:uncharacterized protein F4822DRAFT_192817 [Hypoxylon trugodes]|uniref:uncharacterized protein n=1 Tax=Hypoxylon trugodes TaxID=326681 RepID=UPI00219B4C12|nr:uncharacterized protein F4822DRAFT_192817 [Hypoxylon trugodes]KAI1391687.1 hypothetical protein F4822DRAFT_192817 [Hypoxylon trugodes]
MSLNVITSDVIHFCNICSKPIATESAYKRHLSYCRRTQGRPRKRPRSCKECHSAKAKCSFESECSRCKAKGLYCVYEQPGASALIINANNNYGSVSSSPNSYPDPFYQPPPYCDFGSPSSLPLPSTSPRSILELRADPVARHGAGFILESIRSLPLMMISRETFSWYTHGHWYQSKLPQTIVRCSELATLYAERRPSPRDPFWTLLEEENRRLLQDLPNCSLRDMVFAMQVQIIYMIMFALGHASLAEIPQVRLQMLMTFDLYGIKATEMDNNVWFPPERLDDPNVTWEDWIFAEVRRRLAITWFLLSRVMDLKFGVMCPSVSNCRSLPLPAPDSIWNARTREEWESSRKVHSNCCWESLKSFGDLITARSYPPDSEPFQQLNKWHANCDKLGLLLTLATSMV